MINSKICKLHNRDFNLVRKKYINQFIKRFLITKLKNEKYFTYSKISLKNYFKKTNFLSMRNYYKILGINQNANEKEIKTAYFKLAKEKHPDIDTSPLAIIDFNLILEAYNVLSDEKERKKYDSIFKTPDESFKLEDYENEKKRRETPSAEIKPGEFKYPIDKNFINKSKYIPQVEKAVGEKLISQYHLYEYMLGYSWEKEEKNTKFLVNDYKDKEYIQYHPDLSLNKDVEISIKEYFTGFEKEIKYERIRKCYKCSGMKYDFDSEMTICKNCNGSGKIEHLNPDNTKGSSTCNKCHGFIYDYSLECELCEGTGKITEELKTTLQKNKPFPINFITIFENFGTGNYLENSNIYGNLQLNIKIKDENHFKIINYDIHSVIYIPLYTAIIGGKVEMMTIFGKEHISIPEKSQDNQKIVFKEKGLTFGDNGTIKTGDYIITINIIYPKKYCDEVKEIINKIEI